MDMKKQSNEFPGLLCNLYLGALLFALPLYTGQGYWQLGNTKYILFRNVTLFCMGCWLVTGMPARLRAGAEILRSRKRTEVRKAALSGMDLAVGAYGICTAVSAVCSDWKQLAWKGYEGWFMGAFSQLLFTGIYFFVSRQYNGAGWPLYLGEAALILATGLGLAHRLGIDPLGLMEGWNSGDWEYSHMISTLGNINWLCGYYSVALAFLTVHYLLEKRLWLSVLLWAAETAAFVLLGIQGSQGGLLILAVCGGVSLWLGRRRTAAIKKMLLALTGFFGGMPLMWELMKSRGEKAAVPADGNIFEHTEWYVWTGAAAACFLCFLFFAVRDRRKAGKGVSEPENTDSGVSDFGISGPESPGGQRSPARGTFTGRGKRKAAILAAGTVAGIGLAAYAAGYGRADGFGSGRGFLWRISLESFSRAEPKDMLIGAGPDCYAESVFQRLGTGTEVWKGDHWEGAVFTNAHNEVLSQLCNVGLLGTAAYLAIFAAGLYYVYTWKDTSLRFKWLGGLALAMYGMHSLISFQQVLSTPLLFLVLGLCEAERRNYRNNRRDRRDTRDRSDRSEG